MSKYLVILIILVILSPLNLISKGTAIEVYMKNGDILKGELIEVTDSSLSVEIEKEYIYYDLPTYKKELNIIFNNSIQKVIIIGNFNTTNGAIIGGFTGLLGSIITVILLDNNQGHYQGFSIIIIAPLAILLSAVVGGTVGYLTSSDDIIIEPYPNPEINLEPYTRIQNEPKFLRE